ncbi:ABC transporter permease [Microbacterium sp. CPCC 204701]|uniref:ABC transporter permease n=1 Tax=Microbacterium sp. CPCC 204701 TaxID=2493084 RepID=UPI000FD81803|nr:ABC transporter permease subunit [Microbacterium sp. CPCC 204701]
MRDWQWRAIGILALLVAWQIAALLIDYRAMLPSPIEVTIDFATSFVTDPGLAYLGVRTPGAGINILWTVCMAALGWALGSFLGAAVGLLSARLQWVRNASEPALFLFGSIPALVLAPFCLIWFGQGPISKLILVAFYCFVTVGLVAQSAALSLPSACEEYASTQGLDSRRRFVHVVVPASLPAVLAGLRVALSTAIAVQTTVELLGSQFGAGRIIAIRASQGDVSAVLGLSIAIGIAAILLDLLLQRGIRLFTRWQ